jgi:hypothetical protein
MDTDEYIALAIIENASEPPSSPNPFSLGRRGAGLKSLSLGRRGAGLKSLSLGRGI